MAIRPKVILTRDYEGGGNDWTSLTALDDTDAANNLNPDIVLLDFGSNDFDEGWETADASATGKTYIKSLRSFALTIRMSSCFSQKPTGWVTTDKAEKKFQSILQGAIAKAAKDEKKAGANVVLVGLHGGFNAQKDTKDGTHPNVRGEQKIADKYFNALKKILKKM